jgi:hypothetical protein
LLASQRFTIVAWLFDFKKQKKGGAMKKSGLKIELKISGKSGKGGKVKELEISKKPVGSVKTIKNTSTGKILKIKKK